MSGAPACAVVVLFQLFHMASSFSAVNWVISHMMHCQKSCTRLVDAGMNADAGGGADDVAIGIELLTIKI